MEIILWVLAFMCWGVGAIAGSLTPGITGVGPAVGCAAFLMSLFIWSRASGFRIVDDDDDDDDEDERDAG